MANFDFFLCLRVKFHKSLFWVPILAAGGPHWVLISQKMGPYWVPMSKLGVPNSFGNSVMAPGGGGGGGGGGGTPLTGIFRDWGY